MSVLGSVGASLAQVFIGNVTVEDSLAQHVPQTDSIFTDYEVESRYEERPNVYMMGVTSPNGFQGNTTAFVQLAATTVLWVVNWTGLRLGKQPLIPSKDPGDPNWIFLYSSPETQKVTTGPDQVTPLYRISGTYVYGRVNSPSDIFSLVTYPRAPWIPDVFDRTQPTTYQTQNLMNKTASTSSSSPGSPSYGNVKQ